jgi:hypothetical protein
MTQHSGLPVSGYKPQSDDKVALVNENKALEERVLRQLDKMKADNSLDQRMVSIAYTGIQEAFMWANRAVFQPGRVALPEDEQPKLPVYQMREVDET